MSDFQSVPTYEAHWRRMRRDDPRSFGLSMNRISFDDILSETFDSHYAKLATSGELMLRPREALRYCDHVRNILAMTPETMPWDIPDDVILHCLAKLR